MSRASRTRLFYCSKCHRWLPRPDPAVTCGTGYATTSKGRKVCYACCAIVDADEMRRTGRAVLYEGEGVLTNWPGTLVILGNRRKVARHNIARERVDIWFTFDGDPWHGVRLGDNQLVRCRRLGGAS